MQALKEAAQKANPGSGQVLELGAEILTCTETFSYILSFSCLELSTQKCIQQAELFYAVCLSFLYSSTAGLRGPGLSPLNWNSLGITDFIEAGRCFPRRNILKEGTLTQFSRLEIRASPSSAELSEIRSKRVRSGWSVKLGAVFAQKNMLQTRSLSFTTNHCSFYFVLKERIANVVSAIENATLVRSLLNMELHRFHF